MDQEIKKAIVKKLSRTQLFILCILCLFCFILVVLILCLFAPDQLSSFFNIMV